MPLPFDTIAAAPQKNGLPYCANAPLPPREADLLNVAGQNPAGEPGVNPAAGVALRWESGLQASVAFTVTRTVASNTSYVVLQGDYGDGNWFDLAGCVFTKTNQGETGLFVLPCGPYGTPAVLQQTRVAGQAPAANFFNPAVAPGKFRFVGQGASGGSGSAAAVQVSITYRPMPLR